MSFIVFSGNPVIAQHHPTYISWLNNVQDTEYVYSIDEIPGKSPGIFFDPPAIILIVEKISASDMRQLLYRAEGTGENMCIISYAKPRGNFDKDGISIIDAEYPSSVKKRSSLLSDIFNISHKDASKIARVCDEPYQACIIARQLEFVDDMPQWSDIFIPEDKDSPPWLITDAINSGHVSGAIAETRKLLMKKKVTPQSLAMQITGYYTKAITSHNSFFVKLKSKHIVDIRGMVEDMSYYPQVILQSGKASSQHSMLAYVASLSSRCTQ